jgi:hypothetical protein
MNIFWARARRPWRCSHRPRRRRGRIRSPCIAPATVDLAGARPSLDASIPSAVISPLRAGTISPPSQHRPPRDPLQRDQEPATCSATGVDSASGPRRPILVETIASKRILLRGLTARRLVGRHSPDAPRPPNFKARGAQAMPGKARIRAPIRIDPCRGVDGWCPSTQAGFDVKTKGETPRRSCGKAPRTCKF